jgi:crossover junction endodeoxyribonuclease RuvC
VLVLGIDPGTRVAGYGLVAAEGTRLRLVEAGVLRAPAGEPVERRLARIAAGLREVLRRHRPDAAAVEDAFVKVDPQAALAVGLARGAILAVLGELGIEVASCPPASVKRSVAGNGRASKEQVARMVAAILGVETLGAASDATDALAVAISRALALGRPRPPAGRSRERDAAG